MVFTSFGVDISEEEICNACDCTSLGTDALKAIDGARQLGFARSAKHTISFKELSALIKSNSYPIVFVSLRPIDGLIATHALVVIDLSDTAVTVYDPLKGERMIARQTFSAAWAARHNLALLIEK